MQNFSLETIADEIHFDKTKTYFREVISSYQNENYRSAVVMLWSVAVCDIVFKLENLIDLYNDPAAASIIEEMTRAQEGNPYSSEWEINLVHQTFRGTKLLESPEVENLIYLQRQRHLCAHPVLGTSRELHSPNKDTVRSLLRNTLEGLLVKPPFYTKRIFSEILTDLSEHREALNERRKVKQYIESRYLRRLRPDVEFALFRTLWKLVFLVKNEDCDLNRRVNYDALSVIGERHSGKLPEILQREQEYYSTTAADGEPLIYAVRYFSAMPRLFELMNDAAKLRVQHCVETDPIGKIAGWYVKPDLETHFQDLLEWIEGVERPVLSEDHWRIMVGIEDSPEWQCYSCKLIAAYYGSSRSFNSADDRFSYLVEPNLSSFDFEALSFLISKIEGNDQTYRRGLSRSEHPLIRRRMLELSAEFDFGQFPHFERSSQLEDDNQ